MLFLSLVDSFFRIWKDKTYGQVLSQIFNYYGKKRSQDRTNQISRKIQAYLSHSSICRKSNLYVTKQYFYILHKFYRRCAFLTPLMLNRKLLLWTFCIDRGFACEWLIGVILWNVNVEFVVFAINNIWYCEQIDIVCLVCLDCGYASSPGRFLAAVHGCGSSCGTFH